jgi:hypothetical protein
MALPPIANDSSYKKWYRGIHLLSNTPVLALAELDMGPRQPISSSLRKRLERLRLEVACHIVWVEPSCC